MSGKWRNCYSPAGEEYYAPPTQHREVDCPACRYGTLAPLQNGNWRCIDCGKSHDARKLVGLGLIKPQARTT